MDECMKYYLRDYERLMDRQSTWSLKNKTELNFDPKYPGASKQTSFKNKQTNKTLGYGHLFICSSLAPASQKINVLSPGKVIKIRFYSSFLSSFDYENMFCKS